MLVALPSELVLDILKDLPVWDLAAIQLVSSTFHLLVEAHEDSVYLNAAVYHRFAPSSATPDQSARFTPARVKVALGAQSWKDLCTIWFTTEKGWSGQGLVIESTLPSSPHLQSNFQQLHIDGRLSFVALGTGHLFVHSLNSERFMQLVDTQRSQFLISFDDDHVATVGIVGVPYIGIFHVSESGALAKLRDIQIPQDYTISLRDTAFQLSLPFVAAILPGANSIRVALWNVHSGQLACLLNPAERLSDAWFSDHGFQSGSLRLTKTHLVVSLTTCVLITPLSELAQEVEVEEPRRRFVFPSRSMGMDAPEVMLATAVRAHELVQADSPPMIWTVEGSPAVCMAGATALSRVSLAPPLVILDVNSTSIVPWSDTMTEQRFSSATVSPCGRHLAAVNEYGLLYLAADFARVREGTQSWEAITTRIAFPPPAMQVIWEHEERVVVKAGGSLYVINLDPTFHRTTRKPTPKTELPLPSFLNLIIHRLNHFSDAHQRMLQGSSTQVSAHGIWTLSTAELWQRRVQRGMAGQQAAAQEGEGVIPEEDEDVAPASDIVFVDFTHVGLPTRILPRH